VEKQRHGVTTFLSAMADDNSTIIELMPDLVIVIDHDGNIRKVNSAFERTLGYKRSEMYGSGIARIVVVEDLSNFIKAFSEFVPSDPQPFRLYHKDYGVVAFKLIKWAHRRGRSFIFLRRVKQ
jgi:PAS domain S-box-containing protein